MRLRGHRRGRGWASSSIIARLSISPAITVSSRAPAPALSGQDQGQGRTAVPRYIREDFFLGGTFHNLDDLERSAPPWLDTIANPRVHATTRRIVNEAFAEEKPALKPSPSAAISGGAPIGAARALARRHGERRRQSLQRAGHDATSGLRRPTSSPMRFASSRTARSSPPTPRWKGAAKRHDPAHRKLARFLPTSSKRSRACHPDARG